MRSTNVRHYRMDKRADNVGHTRRRIVEATVRLHGSVGPAATTIAGIAAEAGVTRLTVYRHFADDDALFQACMAHWLAQHVPPDPERWCGIADPAERLRAGLEDLYRFYRDGEPMLTLVHRDWDHVPEAHREASAARNAALRDVLLAPLATRGARRSRVCALLGHAMAFPTWRSLCVDQGLSDQEAVEAMTTLVLHGAGTQV